MWRIKDHLKNTVLTAVGKKVSSSKKIIHLHASKIEFNYPAANKTNRRQNGQPNQVNKKKIIFIPANHINITHTPALLIQTFLSNFNCHHHANLFEFVTNFSFFLYNV